MPWRTLPRLFLCLQLRLKQRKIEMHGELVTVTTRDHLRLHGLFCPAKVSAVKTATSKGTPDSAVLLHGLAGNFYSSRLLLHFADALNALGIDVVLVNTRGHEMINTLSWGGKAKYVGAALENVDDCRHDIAAWTDFLVNRGSKGVMLFGHSLGAIKSLYSQAHEPHPNVKTIVALSATRLSYAKISKSPQAEQFQSTMKHCKQLIEEGQGDRPIHVPVPFPTWMSPAGYVKKYGPDETYNWLRFVDRVKVPTLLLFGSRELNENPAFMGLSEELEALKDGWNPLTIGTIENADHFYTSKFGEADDFVSRWLTS
jgi:pimeloyl-ACP methyl ester carboxylesterase